eukprot:UC4_evm1s579
MDYSKVGVTVTLNVKLGSEKNEEVGIQRSHATGAARSGGVSSLRMKQRFIDFPKSYPVKKNRTGEIVTSEDGEVAFWAQEGSEGLRLGIKNGFIVVRWGQNFELTTKIQMKLGVWTAVGMTWGMSDGKLS